MQNTAYVIEQKPDHAYRTEIPNVLWDLGLNAFAMHLYSYYKKVAGDEGYCSPSRSTIQDILGMSPNTIIKYRNILAKPFDLLNGKSLITFRERFTDKGDPDTVFVEIVDLGGREEK